MDDEAGPVELQAKGFWPGTRQALIPPFVTFVQGSRYRGRGAWASLLVCRLKSNF